MSISEILYKMANGEELTAAEKEYLRRVTGNVERMTSLVSSWVVPGSSVPYIRDLKTSNVRVDSGEIQLGSGVPGEGFSGVRIAFPAFTYDGEEWNLAGINDDVLQVGFRASDGKFIAGQSEVVIDETGLSAGNGKVLISGGGINILAADSGDVPYIVFYNAAGTDSVAHLKADANGFQIGAENVGGIITIVPQMTNGTTPGVDIKEDETLDNRLHMNISIGTAGGLFSIDNEFVVYAKATTGRTYIALAQATTTPPTPTNENGGIRPNIYIKSNKIVFQFDDGGTVRYKYLDLTGTGVTWVHTTTAP